MHINEIYLLKQYLGETDLEITPEDIPPIRLVIKAAEKGHKGCALRLLKASSTLLKGNSEIREDVVNYLTKCTGTVTDTSTDLNKSFNLKAKGAKAASSDVYDRDIRLAVQKQMLLEQGKLDSQIDAQLAKDINRTPDVVRKAHQKYKVQAKQFIIASHQLNRLLKRG